MLETHTDDAGTAHIILNCPERHNAFNEELIAALTHAVTTHSENPQVRALLLSGHGKSFCAGADIDWMRRAAAYTPEQNVADAQGLATLLHAIDTCPKPVLARIHGTVSGGGIGLVACADMVVADIDTKFRFPEVRLGLLPATIAPFVLAKIGQSASRRYMLTAEPFDAETARQMGLIHETAIDADAAHAQITHWLSHLEAAAPGALTDTKSLIADPSNTAQRLATRRATPEAREGLSAFLEKRAPQWK